MQMLVSARLAFPTSKNKLLKIYPDKTQYDKTISLPQLSLLQDMSSQTHEYVLQWMRNVSSGAKRVRMPSAW